MKKGFTLIEMIFIMAIIAVLSIFSYTLVSEISQSTMQKTIESEKFMIIEKEKLYFQKYGRFFTIKVGSSL